MMHGGYGSGRHIGGRGFGPGPGMPPPPPGFGPPPRRYARGGCCLPGCLLTIAAIGVIILVIVFCV